MSHWPATVRRVSRSLSRSGVENRGHGCRHNSISRSGANDPPRMAEYPTLLRCGRRRATPCFASGLSEPHFIDLRPLARIVILAANDGFLELLRFNERLFDQFELKSPLDIPEAHTQDAPDLLISRSLRGELLAGFVVDCCCLKDPIELRFKLRREIVGFLTASQAHQC
jgi:hypothetical protein